MREIAKALRRHVDQKTLQQVINNLLDVPGNKSFRDRIEMLAHELLKTERQVQVKASKRETL